MSVYELDIYLYIIRKYTLVFICSASLCGVHHTTSGDTNQTKEKVSKKHTRCNGFTCFQCIVFI